MVAHVAQMYVTSDSGRNLVPHVRGPLRFRFVRPKNWCNILRVLFVPSSWHIESTSCARRSYARLSIGLCLTGKAAGHSEDRSRVVFWLFEGCCSGRNVLDVRCCCSHSGKETRCHAPSLVLVSRRLRSDPWRLAMDEEMYQCWNAKRKQNSGLRGMVP